MAKYLVTGAAGFIGSSLCRALVARGDEVRGVDNFITGLRENIADLLQVVDFREMDILDTAALADATRGMDFVLHQAALASVPRSVKDPVTSHRNNIEGTLNVLMAAREAGVKRVIYAASSSAYGDTPTLPKREDMTPTPLSPYAVQKLAGEHYMAAFYKVYGLETVSLRYFNVFGPFQDPNSMYSGVLARFTRMMLRGEKPTIDGDGEQSRDFSYIANSVRANFLACEAPAEKVAGRMFNIATGRRITLNETVKMLRELTGYDGEVAYGPPRAGDVKHSLADISLAREAMGYEPLVQFKDGLKETVKWYKSRELVQSTR
jgi:nucleoside-diphosphate-sugar epimerase